jgi:hypothetical protein
MSIDTETGSALRFISIEQKDADVEYYPDFAVGGAIYNEETNSEDGENYYYTAFTMDDALQVLRITNSVSPAIDWNREVVDLTTEEEPDDFYRRKEINFIHEDPNDDQVLYMSGRIQGSGTLVRFSKSDGGLKWWAKFAKLSNILAFSYGTDDNLFICGDYQPNEKADSATPDQEPFDGV